MNKSIITFAFASALAAGCVAEEEAVELGAVEAESSTCREVRHYTYNFDGSTYRWDVTTQLWDGKQFVDERRIGGGFYRQFRVSPVWSWCPNPNESVTLKNSTTTLTGIHVCLPDGREEYHGSDFQRLLVKSSPFVTYNCQD